MTRFKRSMMAVATLATIAVLPFTNVVTPSLAGEPAAYTRSAFDKAQADGKHIVIEVFKKGCPTCKLQQPGLKQAQAKYPGAKFMKVDFLNDAAPVKRFKAVKQSTIIVFKGSKEVARTVGETNASAIVSLIGKGA